MLVVLVFAGAAFFYLTSPLGKNIQPPASGGAVRIQSEESVVIDVVDRVSPAVVTVNVTETRPAGVLPFIPIPRAPVQAEQDIGSGFIVGRDGLVVTNKHVVSQSGAKYRIITKDGKSYDVTKIYRDPANDLAILKIDPPAGGLPIVELGNSDTIKVGQLAIAIGTALGEFRSTVTTGVISGVGRGITAGDPLAGAAEKLDNVLQTSAAINPGNSGGPLLNSSGQVVGVNVAVSQEGQNIGFALPINVVRDALANFNQTGQFNRPFLGVRYKMITRAVAVQNNIPEGAYVLDVVEGSPAQKAGIAADDIITKMGSEKISGSSDLSSFIAKKKVGDAVSITVDRNGSEKTFTVTLGNAADQSAIPTSTG